MDLLFSIQCQVKLNGLSIIGTIKQLANVLTEIEIIQGVKSQNLHLCEKKLLTIQLLDYVVMCTVAGGY